VFSRFPVAFRRTGIRFLGHPVPAEVIRFPHGQRTERRLPPPGPQRGCRVPHKPDTTGVGAPYTPGPAVFSGRGWVRRPAPAASQRPVLHPAGTSHRQGSRLRGIIGGSLAFTRPVFPFTCGLRMEQTPLGLITRASHPAVTGNARRVGDRPSNTDLESHPRHTSLLDVLTDFVRPHVAPQRWW
jgi:hypothetical protein